MGQLDGKISLVTGGSTGIRVAIARRFVAEGATVYLTGRRKPELAGRGIRVNALSPGPIETPGVRGLGGSGKGEQQLADRPADDIPSAG
ncbi:hypothetical protein [Streptomyces sp. NPDC056683]|uniref:hypothetical protein n=1 Tax=Streptomyces sp. NPDC056683 TaxID=3345910 RepID=UPI00369A4064